MKVPLMTGRPAASRLVKEYDLGDAATMNASQRDHYEHYFPYLGQHCVFIGDECLVRQKSTDTWTKMPVAGARRTLWQQHGSSLTEYGISKDAIKTFLSEAAISFDGTILIPNGPQFCLYRGSKRVNVWKDTRFLGDDEDLKNAEDLLRIINENLCSQKKKSIEAMIDEIAGDDCRSEFRYVMHWLAANYQYPGTHLNTALWFCGPQQGVGKGTLVRVMKDLLGAQYVGKATDGELTRQWSEFLKDKILIEYDEVNISSKGEISKKMKEWIGNDEIQLEIRRSTPQFIPNTANWLCTTNELHPIFIDKTDRRHTFIKTTDDIQGKNLADRFNQRYYASCGNFREDVLSGFSALLGLVSVDMGLIKKCLHTEIRAEIIANSMDPVELWFDDFAGGWNVGDYRLTGDLWRFFKKWRDEKHTNCYIGSQHMFTRQINRHLVAGGYIKPHRDCVSRGYIKLQNIYESKGGEILTPVDDDVPMLAQEKFARQFARSFRDRIPLVEEKGVEEEDDFFIT